MHDQIVKLVTRGQQQSQTLIESIRDIQASVSHATSIGADIKLATLKAELEAFVAWDQTGDIPLVNSIPVAKPNPKFQPEYISTKIVSMDNEGNPIIVDGRTQYVDTPEVLNPKHNTSIAPYVFQTSTGIEVSNIGTIAGTDESISSQLTRLYVASLLNTFLNSTPEGQATTVLQMIESVTTV